MLPIIMPIFLNSDRPKCPKCNQDEEIISVCKKCGYEYIEDDSSCWWCWFVFVFIIVFMVWFMWMILSWIAPIEGNPTLWECMKNSFNFFASKKIF